MKNHLKKSSGQIFAADLSEFREEKSFPHFQTELLKFRISGIQLNLSTFLHFSMFQNSSFVQHSKQYKLTCFTVQFELELTKLSHPPSPTTVKANNKKVSTNIRIHSSNPLLPLKAQKEREKIKISRKIFLLRFYS